MKNTLTKPGQDGVVPLDVLEKREDIKLRHGGYKSFDDWIELDRRVFKGQRAKKWFSNGEAAFHRNQTVEQTADMSPGEVPHDDCFDGDYFDDPWLFT